MAHENYLELLDARNVLVTPTRRLAALVANRYSTAMLRSGRATWQAPPVMPLAAWLADSFLRITLSSGAPLAGTMLLSVEQELALWEQAIERDGDTGSVRLEAIARLAADAWASLQLWELPYPLRPGFGHRQEVRAFARWCERFERLCREHDAVDRHRFARAVLSERLASGSAPALPAFRFFGFPRLPRLLRGISERLRHPLVPARPDGRPRAYKPFDCRAYASGAMETEAVMAWARAEKERDPDAVVVIALAGARRHDHALSQRFLRALRRGDDDTPRHATPQLDTPVTSPLADSPLVDTALLLLDVRTIRPWQDVSRLLLSPYWGEARAERGPRALLDVSLRRNGPIEFALDTVIDAAARRQCPAAQSRLTALQRDAATAPRRQRLHEWMQFAEKRLETAGWPGEFELDAAEQAVLNEWQRVMDSMAALDAVIGPVSWPVALAKWRTVLRQRRIAPRAAVDAVAIVSLDEAYYLQPERLWVAGLDDAAWPEQVHLNPLLPLTLQRECGVPGADPGLELDHALGLVQRLRAAHAEAIWSFASVEEATPHRAFAGVNAVAVAAAPVQPWAQTDARFEVIDDTSAGALPEHQDLRGGVSLFSDQAACPFRAFALHRLAAAAPEDATPGLNALQRGNLVHAVFATFWQTMRTSARLAAATPEDVTALLETCASAAVDQLRGRYRMLPAYWDLERERLVELASEWLRLETARGEFSVVACEQAGTSTVGALTINTRIDRIDRLSDGGLVIIDYKTGEAKSSSWTVPRPDQPQLPLYAINGAPERVSGIAYAQVKKGKCGLIDAPAGRARGAATDAAQIEEWQRQLTDWAGALQELSAEISSGHALADPKHGSQTCRYCDLQSLCRIYEPRENDDDAEPQ